MNESLRDFLMFPKRMTDAVLRGLGRMVTDYVHSLGIEIPTPQEAQDQWDEICRVEFGYLYDEPQVEGGRWDDMGNYMEREQ